MKDIGRPQTPVRVPVVLSRQEVARLLAAMKGVEGLIAQLLYGTGMRKMECLRLRVKDLDFDRGLIIVREGKGKKDRITMLPVALTPSLREQLAYARALWGADRAAGRPRIELPGALARKYPRAGESWGWFWVFPSDHEAAAFAGGITCTKTSCRGRSSERRLLQESSSRSALTHCGIRLPRTCSSAGRTSARFRNCSAIATWIRQ